MNPKNLARILLLLVVGGSIAWFAVNQWQGARAAANAPSAAPTEVAGHDHVLMTYFTTNVRCRSCHKIEALAREAAEVHHADAIADGRLVFRVINTDDPGMEHYVKDYNLAFKTVIVSRFEGGREVEWKNMDDVWEYLGEPEVFHAYLESQLNQWGVL